MIIAVDFDGTLAHYDGYKGIGAYGPVIPMMKKRVEQWIKDGNTVAIFTARLANDNQNDNHQEWVAIRKWLKVNGLPALEITATKHKKFTEFWDDRAIGVVRNTGRVR